MEVKQESSWSNFNNWMKSSVSVKLVSIGILLLLMLIPIEMIQDVIRERAYNLKSVKDQITSDWSRAQTINGPVLTVPFNQRYVTELANGEKEYNYKKKYAHFLPFQLDINGDVTTETKSKGIYEAILYRTGLNISGSFKDVDFEEFGEGDKEVLWDQSFLSFSVGDLRGVEQQIQLDWNGSKLDFQTGAGMAEVFDYGVSTPVPVDTALQSNYKFNFDVKLKGSEHLAFIPLGKTTNVHLESKWPDPSFGGSFLPTHTTDESGFVADWTVLDLNRNFPQKFIGKYGGIEANKFQVQLLIAANEYQQTTRSAKYAFMLISLTFLAFFFIQLTNNTKIHSIQFILIGLALSLFYVLLLSLSEHVGFNLAYLIAASSIILEVGFYTYLALKNFKLTAYVSLILAGLYFFIFTILQMEEYSLLMGSIGLFIILGIVMYLSRNINWYNLKKE